MRLCENRVQANLAALGEVAKLQNPRSPFHSPSGTRATTMECMIKPVGCHTHWELGQVGASWFSCEIISNRRALE